MSRLVRSCRALGVGIAAAAAVLSTTQVASAAPDPNPSEIGDFQQAWVQPVLGPAAPPQDK